MDICKIATHLLEYKHMKKVLMVFGPPGAGKGTQANLLAGKFNLIHFDTGKYIESVVHDPANQNDSKIDKLRYDFDNGILLDPMWVYNIVKTGAQKIAESGFGIVFSGSPRTYPEAFEAEGPDNGLISFLEKTFGRENVRPILLNIKPETSIQRNSNRLICTVCGTAVMYHEHARPEFCPFCGGMFKRRTLDTPETIKVRLKQYVERTEPIIAGLKKHGYNVIEVDGEPLPYVVFADVVGKLGFKN